MRLVGLAVTVMTCSDGRSWSCQVIDDLHICFIHSRATSCYNNSHCARENARQSPREAEPLVREMLTMLKLTVVRFHSHRPTLEDRGDTYKVLMES